MVQMTIISKIAAPEELCDAAMGLFKDRNCGDVLCSDEDDAQCSEALLKLTSDCGFAFDCPEPNPGTCYNTMSNAHTVY